MTETPITPTEEPAPVRRLARTREGRWFGGVCAGLGRYFDISPAIYRLAFVALALAGGTGILLYVAAWLVIPDEGRETSVAEQALREHREQPGLAIGVGLIALATILLFSQAAFWPHPGNIWLAALLVGGGLVWWELHGREPVAVGAAAGTAPGAAPVAARPPRRPSLFLPVIGLLLAAAGVAGLLDAVDVWSIDWRVGLGLAVAVVGVAIVVGAATGRRVAGLAGLGLLLLPALALAVAINVPLRGGVGDRLEQPTAVAALPGEYRLAVGDLTLDLRGLDLTAAETTVNARVGVGHVLVRVPEGVVVQARGRADVGDVTLFGSDESGTHVDRSTTYGSGADRIVLDLRVGLGQVEVRAG